MTKWIVRIVVIVAVAIGVVYGGILLWTKVINPPEEKLSTDDLSQVLAETTTTVATLLEAGRLGIEVNEDTGWQYQPEQTTSAIICHHPQAKYFVAR